MRAPRPRDRSAAARVGWKCPQWRRSSRPRSAVWSLRQALARGLSASCLGCTLRWVVQSPPPRGQKTQRGAEPVFRPWLSRRKGLAVRKTPSPCIFQPTAHLPEPGNDTAGTGSFLGSSPVQLLRPAPTSAPGAFLGAAQPPHCSRLSEAAARAAARFHLHEASARRSARPSYWFMRPDARRRVFVHTSPHLPVRPLGRMRSNWQVLARPANGARTWPVNVHWRRRAPHHTPYRQREVAQDPSSSH
jgi:hypothetical protein